MFTGSSSQEVARNNRGSDHVAKLRVSRAYLRNPKRFFSRANGSFLSENDPITAPFCNFGKGSQTLHRQPQGEKQMAVSVRCVTG